jgi:hypothetical protein
MHVPNQVAFCFSHIIFFTRELFNILEVIGSICVDTLYIQDNVHVIKTLYLLIAQNSYMVFVSICRRLHKQLLHFPCIGNGGVVVHNSYSFLITILRCIQSIANS